MPHRKNTLVIRLAHRDEAESLAQVIRAAFDLNGAALSLYESLGYERVSIKVVSAGIELVTLEKVRQR